MANPPGELPTPESIAKYVKQNSAAVKKAAAGMMTGMLMGKAHGGGMESVREDDYNGHHIVIRTSYTITVDGKEIMLHLDLTNDGDVQYHGLPNYSFDSAIELVRKMIDVYPDDFMAAAEKPLMRRSRGATASHDMTGNMAGSAMPGSAMQKMKSPGRKSVPKKKMAAKPSAKKPAKGGK